MLSLQVALPLHCQHRHLLLLFGRYHKPVARGTALVYLWPADGDLRIGVKASREPKNGILEFWVEIKEQRDRD